uniref:Uncharacterized protein n=1 Tax=Hordeum vulgare subsp. vulgare TaxID=112509 RepID=A0A8I7BCS6_HORVV
MSVVRPPLLHLHDKARRRHHEGMHDQQCQQQRRRGPSPRRDGGGADDLDGEEAGLGGGVLVGDLGEAVEVAGAHVLVLHLEVHVEGVGDVALLVEAVAGAAVSQRRAVAAGARVLDVPRQLPLAVLGGVLVEHAPLLGQVLHAGHGREQPVVALPRQVHGELGLAVVGEDAPVPLEVARRDALHVLVEEPEEVDVHLALPEVGALVLGQLLEEPVVEAPRQLGVAVLVAVRGPADLADDDLEVGHAGLLERAHQGVVVCVEHVGVAHAAVVLDAVAAVEEGELEGEVVALVEAEEGVDVDDEGRAVVVHELDHVGHDVVDVGPELALGRLVADVHVGVERDGGLHLVAEPGLVQRLLDVLERRHGGLHEAAVVALEERLVPHRHVPELEPVPVAGGVLRHPVLGVAVAGHRLQHVVGDAEHDLDAGVEEGADGPGVRVEQLHLHDPVLLEHLDHRGGVQRVRALRSPVHAEVDGGARGRRRGHVHGE